MKKISLFSIFLLFLLPIIISSYSENESAIINNICFTQEDFLDALKNGRCWIIVDGKIFDLTNNNLWLNGSNLGYKCGVSLEIKELKNKGLKFEDLIDYYGDMRYAPKVGKICNDTNRTFERPENCGNNECNLNENFLNCPQDCPSGLKDGYCAPLWDFACDPDCGRANDPNCICNMDGICELEFENHTNCPNDCPPDFLDGFCYKREDNFCDPDCNPKDDPDCIEILTTITTSLPSPTTTTHLTTTTIKNPQPSSKTKKQEFKFLPLFFILFIIFLIFLIYRIKNVREFEKKEKVKEEMIEILKNKLRDGEDPNILRENLIAEGFDPKLLDEAERKLWS